MMNVIRGKSLLRLAGLPATFQRYQQTLQQALEDSFIAQNTRRGRYDFEFNIAKECDFWAQEADKLHWFKKWNKVLDHSTPPFTKWFSGGMMNTCYNAIDRHIVEGFGEDVAIYFDSPVTGVKKSFTYNEMYKEVTRLAAALQKEGVRKGDVVLIYMPMIPEAIFTMMATIRLGAVHSLVFGGFAAMQLSSRITHAQPRVIVTATFGKEGLNREIPYLPIMREALSKTDFLPKAVMVYNRPVEAQRDYAADIEDLEVDGHNVVDYQEAAAACQNRSCDAVPVYATDPVYILYTSGTTGMPKAPVRPSGGHAVALHWSMSGIYGLLPGEPWAAFSDLGWVVGHSYICYAPLLHRNPTVIYEGKPVGTPDAGVLFRMCEEYKLTSFFTSPTALRAVKKEDPHGEQSSQYTMENLRSIFVAGEHLDPTTLEWTQRRFNNLPVIDHWWQTESGWAITSTCMGRKLKQHNAVIDYPPSSSAGKPSPGWHVEVLRKDQTRAEPNELGTIVVKMPLPPGSFSTLFQADQLFVDKYFEKFPGYYDTTDAGYMDKNGHVFVMGRIDDVLNVAGHRLSTGSIEEAIQMVNTVADAAVVGRKDSLKGEVPFAFVVLKDKGGKPGLDIEEAAEDAKKRVGESVRKNVGAIATLSGGIAIVDRLPKTRSGKIARNTLAAMVNEKEFDIPTTVEDPKVYWELASVLKQKFGMTCLLPEDAADKM